MINDKIKRPSFWLSLVIFLSIPGLLMYRTGWPRLGSAIGVATGFGFCLSSFPFYLSYQTWLIWFASMAFIIFACGAVFSIMFVLFHLSHVQSTHPCKQVKFMAALVLSVVAILSLPKPAWAPVNVWGLSMCPSFCVGDAIVMDYRATNIQRNQPIQYLFPSTPRNLLMISRLVGMPGDFVCLLNEDKFLIGTKSFSPEQSCHRAFQIPEGKYFIAGDNGKRSFDSRFEKHGLISRIQIQGVIRKSIYAEDSIYRTNTE